MRNRHDLSGDPADDTIDPYIISLFVPRKVEKKFGVIFGPRGFSVFYYDTLQTLFA
jgi:hypothetical protein